MFVRAYVFYFVVCVCVCVCVSLVCVCIIFGWFYSVFMYESGCF